MDVGTGTGHTAIALARQGVRVTGVDPTPRMLAEAERLARDAGVETQVRWVIGAAEALPLPAGDCDVVTCRRAAHHFTDVGRAVAEMARVLRPGGLVGISDLCPESDLALAADHMERLRDPTHVRMLPEAGWRRAITDAGLRLVRLEVREESVTLPQWLRPLPEDGPEAQRIRAALAGMDPALRRRLTGDDDDRWRKRRVILLAAR